MSSFGLFPALLSLCTIHALAACSPSTCERTGQKPQLFSGGRTNPSKTHYETSALDGTYLFYPGGRTYKFPHGFGRIPDDFLIYGTFVDEPHKHGALVAPLAGNQAGFLGADDEFITIRNDTCAEVFIRVTAKVYPDGDELDNKTEKPPVDAGAPAEAGQ